MMRVGLDTSVLYYVLRRSPSAGQEESAQEVTDLLSLSSQYEFVITMPTIAEVLVPIPADKRRAMVGELERMFRVYAFDAEAAVIAAELWAGRVRASGPNERQIVKVDLQIAATVLRWGVKAFCSYDEQQRKRVHAVAQNVQVGAPLAFLPGQKRLPFKA